jgi:hypothetical protein
LGDAFKNQQFIFGARYAMALGEGFTASLAATKFFSDFDPQAGFATAPARAALSQRYDGSPVSVGLVKQIRAEHKGRTDAWTEPELGKK